MSLFKNRNDQMPVGSQYPKANQNNRNDQFQKELQYPNDLNLIEDHQATNNTIPAEFGQNSISKRSNRAGSIL